MEKKFVVQWDYRSSLGGPYKEGEEISIEEDLAEAIGFDSPGVLKLAKTAKTAKKASPPKEKTAN